MRDDIESLIIETLRGRLEPISKADLFRLCGCENNMECRLVRKTIQGMKRRYPIGSSSSHKGGYLLCDTKEKYLKARGELTSRAKSLFDSVDDLDYSFANQHTDNFRTVSNMVKSWKVFSDPFKISDRPEWL